MRFLASAQAARLTMVKSRNSGVEAAFFQDFMVTPQAEVRIT